MNLRELALTLPCEKCGARPGEMCRSTANAGRSVKGTIFFIHHKERGAVARAIQALAVKAKLIAATLDDQQIRQLRNTVLILRRSGVPLDQEQENKCREFEAVVEAYKQIHQERCSHAK